MYRARHGGPTRSIPYVMLGAALLGTLLVPSEARGASIAQTQAEISQLSVALAQQQRNSETTANQYDNAISQLAAIKHNIARLKRRELQKRSAIVATSRSLVVSVVRAYVLGAADAQVLALFEQNATTSDARTIYQNEVVGNLTGIQHRFEHQKHSLDRTIAEVAVQRSRAQFQSNTMRALLAQNLQNAHKTQITLALVTRSLKTQIISYEIAAGAGAARTRNTSGEVQAVAAASAVGGQSAANQVLTAIQAATPPAPVAVAVSGTPAGSAQGEAALRAAESQIGVPYVWGGETPGQGFDCSGLTQWAWGQAGFTIPRTTEEQYPSLAHVALNALQPGDLLFYYNLDGDHAIDHVVMYAGSGPWGANTIIAAATMGTSISFAPMFTFGLIGAVRP